MPAPDRAFVLNVVWTGEVFPYLQYFVASQLHHSDARFRFVANGCPPEQVRLLEAAAAAHPDRIVDVLDVSPDQMVAHGIALDRVRAVRDDGEFFCTIDPDIKANAPFVAHFAALLDTCDAVTSGVEVFADDNVVPEGHKGVAGEHFYDRHGFVFGCPHLALYRRSALEATCERWGVGIGSAGPDLRDDARARLAELGHEYLVYDTGKIVNALLQADGYRLVHEDLPQLVHVGGVSHYLAPGGYVTNDETGETEPNWSRWQSTTDRYVVAKFAGQSLAARLDGATPPAVPEGAPERLARKLRLVGDEIDDLVRRYRGWCAGSVAERRAAGSRPKWSW